MLSTVGFASIPIFVTFGLRAGAPLATLLAWRYVVAVGLLAAAAGGLARARLPWARAWPILVVGGGGQMLVAQVSLSALAFIPAGTLAFLFYTYPAWVALLAAARGAEPLTGTRAAALALSLSGVAVMVGNPWAEALPWQGVALAIAAAVVYALYIPAIDRLRAGIAPEVVSVHIALGAVVAFVLYGLAAGAFTWVRGGDFTPPLTAELAPMAWLAVLLLAVVSTVMAFLTFLRGLAVLGPVRTAIVSTVEPFWTTILAALVLAEPFAPGTLAGGAMIAAAVLILQRR